MVIRAPLPPVSGRHLRSGRLGAGQSADAVCMSIIPSVLHLRGSEARVICTDAASEKRTRGALKAAADRALIKDRIVIVDSLNYIKGYRRASTPAATTPVTPVLLPDAQH